MAPPTRACLALALIAAVAHSAAAMFIDACGANEFERLYARANFMTVDFRNPETHIDVTRYKRDFADATKYEPTTFITWRFPNGEANDRVFLMLNQMRDNLLIPNQNLVTYSFSNDDVTYTTLPGSSVAQVVTPLTGGDGSWSKNEVSLTLPSPARFVKMTWTPCEWVPETMRATCRNYYSPSVLFMCAGSSAKGEVPSVASCPVTDPAPISPTPSYCGAKVVNDWWDFKKVGSAQNVLGAYSSGDGSMTRTQHHNTKYGFGQGEIAMNLTAGSSYWVESLTSTATCFDASTYTHLLLEISARDGFSTDVVLEQGTAGSCNVRPAERRTVSVNTAQYATFGAALEKKVIAIPLADFAPAGGVDLRNLRTVVLNNFVNPSRNWVYMSTIAFTGAPFARPLAASPATATLAVGTSGPIMGFNCAATATWPSASLKFRAKATAAGARFTVRIRTATASGCRTQATTTVASDTLYAFPADELHLPRDFSIRVTQARVVSVQFLSLTAGSVAIDNVRLGPGTCLEPADTARPDYSPKPYPAGQPQAPVDIFPPANI